MTTITEQARQALANAANEWSTAQSQIEAHKEHQKDIVAAIAEQYNMKKSELNWLFKTAHERSLNDQNNKLGEKIDLYETVFPIE